MVYIVLNIFEVQFIFLIGDSLMEDSNDIDITFDIPHDLLIITNSNPLTAIIESTYPFNLDNIKCKIFFQNRDVLIPKKIQCQYD